MKIISWWGVTDKAFYVIPELFINPTMKEKLAIYSSNHLGNTAQKKAKIR